MRRIIIGSMLFVLLGISAARSATVSGRVFSAPPDVDITGSEPGAVGAKVLLFKEGGDQVGTATADAQGHFSFPNLTPGDYFLTAQLSGLSCHDCAEWFTVDVADVTADVRLTSNATAVLAETAADRGFPALRGSETVFAPAARERVLEVFGLNGARLLDLIVPTGAARMQLPARAAGWRDCRFRWSR